MKILSAYFQSIKIIFHLLFILLPKLILLLLVKSFNEYLLDIFYVLNTILSTGAIVVINRHSFLPLLNLSYKDRELKLQVDSGAESMWEGDKKWEAKGRHTR